MESTRPSELIDPKKKNKKWILDMVKSMHNDFNKNYPYSFYNGRKKYQPIIDYVYGLQDPVKYLPLDDLNKSHNHNLTNRNHDPRILNIISKYFRSVVGRLLNYKLDVSVNPIDPLAKVHIDEYKQKLLTLLEVKNKLSNELVVELEQVANEMGYEIPNDVEEIDIKANSSIPLFFASTLEKDLEWINYLDNFEQKEREAILELIAFNKCAIHTKLNSNGIPESEKVSILDLMVSYHETEDGRDINEIGRFRVATISTIQKENQEGNQLTQKELEQIEKEYQGKYGNDQFYREYNKKIGWYESESFYKYRTLLLDVYFYSYDGEDKFINIDSSDNLRVSKRQFGFYANEKEKFAKLYPQGSIETTVDKVIYKATWVVGTDIIYNYGYYRSGVYGLPIQLINPLNIDGNSVSLVEEMIPIADKANQYWKKIEEFINKARPNGFRLNIDSFLKASEGMKQFGYTSKQMIDMAIKNNIIFESGLPSAGSTYKTFEETFGGFANGMRDATEGLFNCLNLLEQITGFGGAATGTPSPYATKGTSELAVASAETTIRHLYEAKKTIYYNVMKQRCLLLQDSIRANNASGLYYDSEKIKNRKQTYLNAGLYEYSLIVEEGASAMEIQEFKARVASYVNVPLEQGGITASDEILITSCKNFKEAKMLFVTIVKRNMKEAQKRQTMIMEQKSQFDQQTAAISNQMKQEQLQMEIQAEIAKINAKAEQDRMTIEMSKMYDLEILKLKGMIDADQQITQGQIDEILTNIKAKFNMDRMSAKGSEQGKRS